MVQDNPQDVASLVDSIFSPHYQAWMEPTLVLSSVAMHIGLLKEVNARAEDASLEEEADLSIYVGLTLVLEQVLKELSLLLVEDAGYVPVVLLQSILASLLGASYEEMLQRTELLCGLDQSGRSLLDKCTTYCRTRLVTKADHQWVRLKVLED